MTVNLYCHGQRCNALNLLFMIMFVALICRRFLGGFIHALLSRTYLSVSWAFLFFIFKHSQALNQSCKIFHGVLKVLDFF